MKPVRTPASVWRNPIHFIAFGFGIGTIRTAPGTFGTLAAIPVYLLLQDLPLIFYLACVGVLLLLGIWVCDVTSRDIGVDDHSGIVFDEIVGYLLAMTASPPGGWWVLYAFILFRLFDIWKPWPIRLIDRKVHGGIGIMLDDIIAGMFACAVIQLSLFIGLDLSW